MPASNDSILKEFSSFLDAHGDSIYLASFSHIASLPAIILPVKDLVALCASRGILTLIDGAHALGQIPVNVRHHE
jgi:selenocysteine lyase/cysteine desulfurase